MQSKPNTAMLERLQMVREAKAKLTGKKAAPAPMPGVPMAQAGNWKNGKPC